MGSYIVSYLCIINSVDTDLMWHSVASDLDLHCLVSMSVLILRKNTVFVQ